MSFLLFFEFQSTLPRGERHVGGGKMFTINDFNPRSHEGSDGGTERGKSRKYNFNPRSHEGSDMILPCVRIVPLISIHAPTRGATVIGVHFSIICIISIHAPTRGATLTSAKRYRIFVFQSTLPRGERLCSDCPMVIRQLFQSTLPRGERRYRPSAHQCW